MSECTSLTCSECGTEDHVFVSQVLKKSICWNCREKILSEKDPVYAKNVKSKPSFVQRVRKMLANMGEFSPIKKG